MNAPHNRLANGGLENQDQKISTTESELKRNAGPSAFQLEAGAPTQTEK